MGRQDTRQKKVEIRRETKKMETQDARRKKMETQDARQKKMERQDVSK